MTQEQFEALGIEKSLAEEGRRGIQKGAGGVCGKRHI